MSKYLILAACLAVITYFLRDIILLLRYSDYKETLSALLNISSIIFAIVGAWIAIIYPRAMKRVFNHKDENLKEKKALEDADNDATYLGELVEIVLVSAVVLMSILIFQFSVPVAKQLVTHEATIWAKYFLFYFVSILTCSQLYAISRVIMANYFFLNELRTVNADAEVTQRHR